ncbi:hypothetical protein JKF63_01393 [Porcisia hertigi]|uniref:Uncharacterized protein n=1 Tax=Porcisia hertigi TaxID=2761500 RepID=A0A836I3L7_9TRYP|nr:hypothetical protein JKF63_01393 [Porcisia hertigi]
MEELPLLRAKGSHVRETTGPSVGPGSYDLDSWVTVNCSRAPFNSTSLRQPLLPVAAGLPGPGAYNVPTVPNSYAFGLGSPPFVSESSRFVAPSCDEYPGPGSYNVTNYSSKNKNPRSYTFSGPREGAFGSEPGGNIGPGCYSPNYAAADRRHPKAAGFANYSARELPRPPAGPGPGSYDPLLGQRSIAAAKPSSMFATKTKRSICGGSGSNNFPGPGTYDVGLDSERDRAIPREHFSAFGTSSSRFAHKTEGNLPGPGAYTGELAPRRFLPKTDSGSAVFLSENERFPGSVVAPSPGPGTYDARLPCRHQHFGEPMPFGSTVSRFSPVWSQRPLSEPLVFSGDPDSGRALGRRRIRPFIQGKIQPSSAPPPLQDRAYNVRYDWPKPTSMATTTFGTSERLPLHQNTGVPGPGSYCGLSYPAPGGRKHGSSTWGRDVRFSDVVPPSGSPDPGKYYHASTFLKKTFNATIGSDTAWIE